MSNPYQRRINSTSKNSPISKIFRRSVQNVPIYLFIASAYIVTVIDRAVAITPGNPGDVNGICDKVPPGGSCHEVDEFGMKIVVFILALFISIFLLGNLISLIDSIKTKFKR